MRYRSRATVFNLPCYWNVVKTPGTISAPASPTSLSSAQTGWVANRTESMEDEITIGYFGKARRRQDLPVNDLVHIKPGITAGVDTTTWTDTRSGYTGSHVHNFVGYIGAGRYAQLSGLSQPWNQSPVVTSVVAPDWPDAATELQAVMALANTRKWDLLTFGLEFGKTNDLVLRSKARFLKRTNNIITDLTRRLPRKARTLQAFADTWLESRYGWRVLSYDLEAASESIQRLQGLTVLKERVGREPTSVVATHTVTSVPFTGLTRYSNVSTTFSSNLPIGVSHVWTKSIRRSVSAGIGIELLGNDMYMSDPLVSLWEVIPFSFIVDWFSTIGDAVAAHSPFASTRVKWAYTTSEELRTSELVGLWKPLRTVGTGWTSDFGPPRSFSFSHQELTKTRLAASPSLSLTFDLNFDYKKVVDLATIGVSIAGLFRQGGFLGKL